MTPVVPLCPGTVAVPQFSQVTVPPLATRLASRTASLPFGVKAFPLWSLLTPSTACRARATTPTGTILFERSELMQENEIVIEVEVLTDEAHPRASSLDVKTDVPEFFAEGW